MTSKEKRFKKYKARTIRETCGGCPSQWEGTFKDGESLYIRCRHGRLSIRKGNQEIFENYPEGIDGVISFDKVKELSKSIISWKNVQWESEP